MGHPPPTIEQRIRAAMALAGVDLNELARRINTTGYGWRTIQRILDPRYTARVAEPRDLRLIGEACGVSESFWTIDFATLGEAAPDLDERVEALEEQMETVLHQISLRLARGAAAAAAQSAQPPRRRAIHGDPPKRGPQE